MIATVHTTNLGSRHRFLPSTATRAGTVRARPVSGRLCRLHNRGGGRSIEVRVGRGRMLASRVQLSYEHLGSNASRIFLLLSVARNPRPLSAAVRCGNLARCAYGKALAHMCVQGGFIFCPVGILKRGMTG
jgi:hypothetical protein